MRLASTILVLTVKVGVGLWPCTQALSRVWKEEMSLGTRLCGLMIVTHVSSLFQWNLVTVWSLNVLITSTILEYEVQMS